VFDYVAWKFHNYTETINQGVFQMEKQLLILIGIITVFYRRSWLGSWLAGKSFPELFKGRKSNFLSLLFVMLMLGQPAMALEGPVNVPPFGVSVSDSDPGGPDDKEQWGRVGGRILGFTVYQVDDYSLLKWQPIEVGIAFDGAIDPPDETLTLYSTDVGSAVWIGSTTVEVLDEDTNSYETVPVNTEFVLTVKDSSDSFVPLEIMDGLPTVNLKTLPTAFFTATLEMRAQMPSYDSVTAICPYSAPIVGDYYPALDVFDCLQTNPAYDRPAISRFEYGFFYEISTSGCDLCGNYANMVALVGDVQDSVDDIYMWTDFLYTDWPLRIGGINAAHAQINDKLATVDTNLNNVDTMVGVIGSKVETCAQQVKLDEVKDIVKLDPDWHLLMFGLQDFIQDETLKQYVPAVLATSPLYQKLDANSQGISDALVQCEQNAQALTDISTQMQQYADIIVSLTAQLQEANQTIADLNANIGSMYTQEELDQAIADSCPGISEFNNPPGPPQK